MFVVKLKFKNSESIKYCNNYIIEDRQEIKQGTSSFSLASFFLSLDSARELHKNLIFRYKNSDNIYDVEKVDYVAIVELSNYSPHSEYQVIEFYDKF